MKINADFKINADSIAAIRKIPHFRQSQFSNLDLNKTLDFFDRRYVQPCRKRLDITQATVVDCASGFGWLSFAFLQAGAKQVYLVEPDKRRLEASREIAKIIGVEQKCQFVNSLLQDLDLAPDSVDIFASIETLEHVGRENVNLCLETIAKVTREVVLLTTPNQLFPLVNHDTKLPLAHWLPAWLRKPYAQIFNRAYRDLGNYFLTPWDLIPVHRKFKPDTNYTMFSSLQEFDEFYPNYLPYDMSEQKRYREVPPAAYRFFVSSAGKLFGKYAFTVSPNLGTVWVRRASS